MMNKKTVLTIIAFQIIASAVFSQELNNIIGTSIEIDETELSILESSVSEYSLYQIDILKKDVDPTKNNGILRLTLDNEETRMRVYPNNLMISEDIQNTPHLLGGSHTGNNNVSLTINDDFIYGFIQEDGHDFYIEPLWYFEPNQPKNVYVIYDAEDVIENSEHRCGVDEVGAKTPQAADWKANTNCREVDFALANDFSMFTKYVTTTGVMNHNLGVLNNVQTNYNCVFNADLQYIVVTFFIPTTSPDPFTTSTNAGTLLNNFTNWAGGFGAGGGGAAGLSGGFGIRFDMAGLWTDRNFNGGTVGIAFLNNWFHTNQDFTGNAVFLNVLHTHEMGHNWGSNHDAAGSPFIMAPAVQNTSTWSTTSVTVINNRLNGISNAVLPSCALRFVDNDGDGFGSTTVATTGGVSNDTDCNDNNATVFPGAPELCDGLINDCNTTSLPPNEIDNDGDGFVECDISSGGWQTTPPRLGGDCDDTQPTAFPGAPELCDGIINDCNTTTLSANEMDNDGDGFVPCTIDPTGWKTFPVLQGDDCDDTDPNVNPSAVEVCDLVDNDCDGQVDEGFATTTYFRDSDGDGFGDPLTTFNACTLPPGFSTNDRDCNDNDPNINPNAPEDCTDGIDNNCNGAIDEGTMLTWFFDGDLDGFGDPNNTIQDCTQPAGYLSDNTDCNDADDTVFPGAPELCDGQINNCNTSALPAIEVDNDGDGFVECVIDAGGWDATPVLQGGDCNDTNDTIFPGATELCDGLDNDCDGQIDEVAPFYYTDSDGDGFGNPLTGVQTCNPTTDQVLDGTDCDDTNSSVFPGAPELCDNLDNDCDGQIDEGATGSTYYTDNDGDGFGDPSTGVTTCNPNPNQVLDGTDCDDTNNTVFPGATEICDNLDNDCNGLVDDGASASTYYTDNDGDGFGDPATGVTLCTPGPNQVLDNTDCDDNNNTVFPGATEICDNLDNDCNGLVDDGAGSTYYTDNDGDGFGNPSTGVQTCSPASNQVLDNTDCNDNNNTVFPGATEICGDNLDNNCDGIVDFGCQICDDINLVIDNGNLMNIHRAQQTIDSDALINLNSVLYTAGNNIELLPPFEVASGNVFEARIEPCMTNFTGDNDSDNARSTNSEEGTPSLNFTFDQNEQIQIKLMDSQNNIIVNMEGIHSEIYPDFLKNVTTLTTGSYTITVVGEEKTIEKKMNITQK